MNYKVSPASGFNFTDGRKEVFFTEKELREYAVTFSSNPDKPIHQPINDDTANVLEDVTWRKLCMERPINAVIDMLRRHGNNVQYVKSKDAPNTQGS